MSLLDKPWKIIPKGDGNAAKEYIESYWGDYPLLIQPGIHVLPDTVDVPVETDQQGYLAGFGADQAEGLGSILKLGDGVDGRVLDFQAGANHTRSTVLRDFCVDGNKANQGAGDYAIYIHRPYRNYIENVSVTHAYGIGMILTGVTGTTGAHNEILRLRANSCGGNGLHTVAIDENWITDLHTGFNGGYGLYLSGGSNVVKGHIDVGSIHAVRIGPDNTLYTGFTLDAANADTNQTEDQILIDNADNASITHGYILDAGRKTVNTYDAIRGVSSERVVLYDIRFATNRSTPRYWISSSGTSNYWALDRINYIDAPGTADRSLVGANNTIDLEWT